MSVYVLCLLSHALIPIEQEETVSTANAEGNKSPELSKDSVKSNVYSEPDLEAIQDGSYLMKPSVLALAFQALPSS